MVEGRRLEVGEKLIVEDQSIIDIIDTKIESEDVSEEIVSVLGETSVYFLQSLHEHEELNILCFDQLLSRFQTARASKGQSERGRVTYLVGKSSMVAAL